MPVERFDWASAVCGKHTAVSKTMSMNGIQINLHRMLSPFHALSPENIKKSENQYYYEEYTVLIHAYQYRKPLLAIPHFFGSDGTL
jgi:hypothetical protein